MSIDARAASLAEVGVPRSLVIAEAWAELSGVEAFTGRSGLPLARTVKLLLDPLVIRPVARPQLAGALLSVEAAAELRGAVRAAEGDLAAAAEWFLVLKGARRRAGITAGNPQELYFQRAYELARRLGAPDPGAEAVAEEALAEIHDDSRATVAQLRDHLTDPRVRGALQRRLDLAWLGADRATREAPLQTLERFLDGCPTADAQPLFDALVEARGGSAAAVDLDRPGGASVLGLSDRERVEPPPLGDRASKSALPPPFDRSVFERLFASFAAAAESGLGIPELVDAEIARSAGRWQLASEPSRVLLWAAAHASSALADGAITGEAGIEGAVAEPAVSTEAARRLLARWRREPFVHRMLRLAETAPETERVREAVMRRLWVRLHGRELRDEPVGALEAWDLVDGALRSVILDRRGRVKASIEREAVRGAA